MGAEAPSLLAGLIVDADGNPMTSVLDRLRALLSSRTDVSETLAPPDGFEVIKESAPDRRRPRDQRRSGDGYARFWRACTRTPLSSPWLTIPRARANSSAAP